MTRTIGLWGAHIQCGGTIFPAAEFTQFPAAVSITMAAIDPTAEPTGDGPKRATLKIIRRPMASNWDGDGSDEDSEEDSDEEDSDEEKETPKKKSGKKDAPIIIKEDVQMAETDSKKKAESNDEDEEDSDDEGFGLEIEEFVLCTLDTEKNYQQPLAITIGEDEEVFFRVSGTYDIYLTGNYVVDEHMHDHGDEDSEDDEEYDLSPSEDDEFDFSGVDSEDELDDLKNPRIQEVESEDEPPKEDKKLTKKEKKALKRSADEASAESTQKKQKGADGKAVATDTPTKKEDKKVKFAKNLEQGPTPSPAQKKDEVPKKKEEKPKKEEAAKKPASRVVNGVTIVDATDGSGPQAKNGQRISVRYIGKLQKNGKQFDANVSGKPFSFVLGKGEVIKGWDIGMAGMRVGGARTLTIPPQLAYGNQSIPGIPKGSTLVFEVKCLGIK